MIDNISAYQTLGWILNHSDSGFFSLIESESMQSWVVSFYQDSNIAVYDYLVQQEEYTFQALEDWISSQPDKNAYFLLNFQRAISQEQILTRLNFSWDMLRKLDKNIIFCMTKSADDLLNRSAYDFYSYIKLVVVFQDEFAKTSEQQTFHDAVPASLRQEKCNQQLDIEPYGQWSEEKQLAYAISLSNRAEALIQECRYSDARYLIETALNIKAAIWGAEHPSIADTCNNIAGVYQAQGDYAKALEYYQKNLAICEKVLGVEHPNTGTTYNNIASVYQAQGDYAKALEYFQKDLAICEKVLGVEHPSTGITYNNIAGVYRAQGEYEKADNYYKSALAVLQTQLGPKHPNTIYAQNQIEALRSQGLL